MRRFLTVVGLAAIALLTVVAVAQAHRPLSAFETEIRAREHIRKSCAAWNVSGPAHCVTTSNISSPSTGLLRTNEHSRDYHGWYRICDRENRNVLYAIEVRVSAHDGVAWRIGTSKRYDGNC